MEPACSTCGRVITRPILTPYIYALNNPLRYIDPSGEIVPIFAIAGIGFAAGAIYDAYQQTNGFTNFCSYNIAQTLAMGVGGAAAATSAVILAVSGAGMVGMGLQGAVLGLSSLGLSGSILTSTFIAGTTAVGWSSTAMAWLFTSTSSADSIRQTLAAAATRAQNYVASGNRPVHGTGVHTAFAQEVRALGQPNLISEVSYLTKRPVQYGTPGSVRIDVINRPIDNPIAAFDLITGSAALTASRIQQIQSNLPGPNIPVFEVRP